MKKSVILSALIAILLFTFSAFAQNAAAPATEKKAEPPKLAVNELTGKGVDADAVSTLTEVLCTELSNSGKYGVMCSGDLKAILASSQQEALLGTCDDEDCFAKMGQLVNAPFVLTGSIGKIQNKHIITLNITDTENKSVIKRISYECSDDLIKGIKKAAEELLKK